MVLDISGHSAEPAEASTLIYALLFVTSIQREPSENPLVESEVATGADVSAATIVFRIDTLGPRN